MSLKKDDVIQCEIESLAFGGRGVARVDGMAVFVAGGLPGDTVSARIVKAKKRFAEAVTESIVTPSDRRVQPECPHFGTCGGCASRISIIPSSLPRRPHRSKAHCPASVVSNRWSWTSPWLPRDLELPQQDGIRL